jgi:glycosyltransferase
MKISVITINYNNAAGLQKTVDSVLAQTCDDFEYLIIDGGSSDGSDSVIDRCADRLAFSCNEKDGGIYNAMNKGVSHAKGDYLLFLNSGDVFVDSEVLQRMAPALGAHDFIYGNLIFRENDGREWIQTPPDHLSIGFFMDHSLPHPATFISRRLLADTPYDENYRIIADWVYFVHKIVHEGCSYLHVDTVVSRFMMDGVSSGTSKHDEERARAFNALFPPLIAEAANAQKSLQKCGLERSLTELASTRKLHKRLSPVVRAIINCALSVDRALKPRKH